MDKKDKEKKNKAMSYLNKNKGLIGRASKALTGRQKAIDDAVNKASR